MKLTAKDIFYLDSVPITILEAKREDLHRIIEWFLHQEYEKRDKDTERKLVELQLTVSGETSDTVEVKCLGCGIPQLVESIGFGSTAQAGVAIFAEKICPECGKSIGHAVGRCAINLWKARHGKP